MYACNLSSSWPRQKAREGHGKSCPSDFVIFPYQEVPVFAQLGRIAAGFLGLLLKWHQDVALSPRTLPSGKAMQLLLSDSEDVL